MVPSLGTCFLEDHLAFLSKTGPNTLKNLSLPSLLDGTVLSKVGSTLSKALLFTGSDKISIAGVQTLYRIRSKTVDLASMAGLIKCFLNFKK